jgi:hypothetical protein
MDKNLHNIEDLFKKGLEDNEVLPSEKAWDRIHKRLDKESVINIKRKYRRLQQLAVLLLILMLVAGAGAYLFTRPNEKRIAASRNKNIFNIPTNENTNGVKSSLSSNSSLSKSILKNKSSVRNKLANDSIFEKPNPSSSDKNLSEKNLSEKRNEIAFVNKKASHKNNYLKRTDNTSVSLNKKLKKNFSKGEAVKNKIPPYNLTEKKQQTIITFSKPDSSQKLSLVQGNIFEQKINSINNLLLSPGLSVTNKNLSVKRINIKPIKQSRFSLTAFYSPNITFFHFQKSPSAILNPDDPDEDESEISSWTAGGLIDYSFNKHWNVESGLTLSTSNLDLAPETLYAQLDNYGKIKYQINTSSGYGFILPSFNNNPSVGDSIQSISATHTLQYLEIPLVIKYNINKGKFTINARTGLVANILTNATISTEVESDNDNDFETTNKIHGLKPFYSSGIAGIGLDYNVYKNWSVSFFPSFRFALNSINKDVPVKSFPNLLGFSLGVKLKL